MINKIKFFFKHKHFFCFKCRNLVSVERGYELEFCTRVFNGPICTKCGRSFRK